VRPIAELRELTLKGAPDYEAFEWVAESPQLSSLRVLTVRGLFGDSLAQLVASPHLARLRALRLPSNNLANEGLHALAQSSTLTALEDTGYPAGAPPERHPPGPVIRPPGLGALMAWPGLAHVRSLNLSGNDVSRDGLRALLRSPHAGALRELSLRDS